MDASTSQIRGETNTLPPSEHKKRNLVTLLLDASGSMGPEYKPPYEGAPVPIDELNRALSEFVDGPLHDIEPLERNGEIAIGIFRHEEFEWLQLDAAALSEAPFYYSQYVKTVPEIEAFGGTPMAEAIEAALKAIQDRKQSLRKTGRVHEFRPNIIMLTDGKPSKSYTDAVARLREAEDARHVLFFALGIGEADKNTMERIARPSAYYPMHEASLAECLKFVSNSLEADTQGVDDGPDAAYISLRERFNLQNEAAEQWIRG